VKKTINRGFSIIVSTIICLTQASCIVFEDLNTYLKMENKYDLPITQVGINLIENDFSYIIMDLNIPKGKSENISLMPYHESYSAEVIVYFGDMYSFNEFGFNKSKTTTATLNVNGILE